MATGTISFNLPEEQTEFEVACSAMKYSIALFNIREQLRTRIKYTDTLNETQIETIEWFQEMIVDEMTNQNLPLD